MTTHADADPAEGGCIVKTPKKRYCFNCGAEMGVYADYDPLDDCGARECQRAAQDAHREQQEAAHEQIDRDMGWGDYYGRY